MELKDYILIGISVITLIINILFYVFIAPKISYKLKYKNRLYEIGTEFLDYLVDITGFNNFNGVPTQIRKYSLRIHLLFIDGKAPEDLSTILEDIFQHARKRKEILSDEQIISWNDAMRDKIRILRRQLSVNRNKVQW